MDMLLELGGPGVGHEHYAHGQIYEPLRRFRGWCKALDQVSKVLSKAPAARAMNHPDEVALMFDKRATYARLLPLGVQMPERLGEITCYEELREQMRQHNAPRVFIKLNHGSSASGVVAFRTSGARAVAITSAHLVPGHPAKLFNSLRIQRYDDPLELAQLITMLAAQDVVVERWVPKATLNGRAFDLRVVVIKGRASHVVARSSSSPMTNLHLGNQREALEAITRVYGEDAVASALRLAEDASRGFPQSFYFGADVMLTSSGQPYLIEVNAFGDLLPGLLVDGLDTYGAEVAAWYGAREEEAP